MLYKNTCNIKWHKQIKCSSNFYIRILKFADKIKMSIENRNFNNFNLELIFKLHHVLDLYTIMKKVPVCHCTVWTEADLEIQLPTWEVHEMMASTVVATTIKMD